MVEGEDRGLRNPTVDVSTARANEATPVLHVVCDWDVGLFNLFLGVIAHVHWALGEGRIPVIYYACNNCYLTPNGYRGRSTVWEYYFEPVVPEYPAARIPAGVRQWIADHPFSGRMQPGTGHVVDGTFVTNDGAWHIQVDGEGLRAPSANQTPSPKVRQVASEIVRDYIRPRDYIREKVAEFHDRQMAGRYVIGVHIRGTDANVDATRWIRQSGVRYDRYLTALRRLRQAHPDALILVASDEHASVERIREAFRDTIAYASIRHRDGEVAGRGPAGGILPAYLTKDPELAARNGEEAVIEYLLLCRCNFLIHNFSSIPRAVLLSVPQMPELNVDVDEAFLPLLETQISPRRSLIRSLLNRLSRRK